MLGPAWAGRVLRVTTEAAQEGKVPITVYVEGGGVLLDFSPTGERIQKIAIDDPSRIVVDHCLVTRSCPPNPSPIIRLFRSTGITFQDIPTASTTMLSVETTDAQGDYHSYIFPISIGKGRGTVSKVLIGAVDPVPQHRIAGPPPRPAAITAAQGAKEAEARSLLVDPVLKGRVRQYLQLVNSGMNRSQAAQKAGISMALVNRLEQLGQFGDSASAKTQPPSAPAPPPLPDPPVAPTSPATTATLSPKTKPVGDNPQVQALERGLAIAQKRESLKRNTVEQVQDLIRRVRQGVSLAESMRRSGVSTLVIEQLLFLAGG